MGALTWARFMVMIRTELMMHTEASHRHRMVVG